MSRTAREALGVTGDTSDNDEATAFRRLGGRESDLNAIGGTGGIGGLF